MRDMADLFRFAKARCEDSADQTDLITSQYKTVAEYMGWENIGVVCADGLWGNTIPDDHPALKQARELGAGI